MPGCVFGFVVPCGDVAGLADTLQRMIRDESTRRRFGRCGADRVVRENRWEDKLTLVEDVYRQLVR